MARFVPEIIEPVPKVAKKEQWSLSTQWVDKLSLEQKSEYDRFFAELYFRTGIPFAIIESDAMKSFIRAIRPAYASQMPNRKSLSGNLLDNAYEKLNKNWHVHYAIASTIRLSLMVGPMFDLITSLTLSL